MRAIGRGVLKVRAGEGVLECLTLPVTDVLQLYL